ncbi:MAG: hypothetical protein JKY31_07100 [Rhodobacteraceae bacterium]|nr:hypothetical protein [Paracoccaceae bacterium]
MTTVFVIGAGASKDFGFPDGNELIANIAELCERVKQPSQYTPTESLFGNLLFSDRDVLAVSSAINIAIRDKTDSLTYESWTDAVTLARRIWLAKSIDNFIHQQQSPSIQFLGKLSIVASILKAEARDVTTPKDKYTPVRLKLDNRYRGNLVLNYQALRNTWLGKFFREITDGLEFADLETRFKNTKLIVFNYDGCVEYFMVNAIRTFYDVAENEALKVFEHLQIIHPYGQIGFDDDAGSTEPVRQVEYGEDFDAEKLAIAARRIKTFKEVHNQNNKSKITGIIQDAETLVFLGFGFDEQNMRYLGCSDEKLELMPSRQPRKIFATGYGLTKFRHEAVRVMLREIAFGHAKLSNFEDGRESDIIRLEDATCGDLIDQFGGDFFTEP